MVYSVPAEGTHKVPLFPLIFRTSLADNAKKWRKKAGGNFCSFFVDSWTDDKIGALV